MDLGVLTRIARYPVKSMGANPMNEVNVDFVGLPFDRFFAFVQEGDKGPFPWLTARQCPQLLLCRPEIIKAGHAPEVIVHVPDGGTVPLLSPEFLALVTDWAKQPVRLHSDYRGCQDVAYASIITTATVRAIAQASGVPEDARRFRMNFVVEAGDEPFTERNWVGHTLELGGARFAVHQQDRRCQMITFDPDSAESTPAVLKQLGGLNEAYAGAYCSVQTEGVIRMGDAVRLL